MRLSEFKGEKAFSVAADLIPPITKIANSEIYKKATVTSKMALAEIILRSDMQAAKEILAILADVPPELYVCNGSAVLHDMLSAVSDDDFLSLFISPRQITDEGCSFSVSVNAGV
jgi:hypothetical protein